MPPLATSVHLLPFQTSEKSFAAEVPTAMHTPTLRHETALIGQSPGCRAGGGRSGCELQTAPVPAYAAQFTRVTRHAARAIVRIVGSLRLARFRDSRRIRARRLQHRTLVAAFASTCHAPLLARQTWIVNDAPSRRTACADRLATSKMTDVVQSAGAALRQ